MEHTLAIRLLGWWNSKGHTELTYIPFFITEAFEANELHKESYNNPVINEFIRTHHDAGIDSTERHCLVQYFKSDLKDPIEFVMENLPSLFSDILPMIIQFHCFLNEGKP